jgi:hypothetical protein
MKKLLIVTAVVEALTGLILLAYPPIAIRLLLGPEITRMSVLISRLTGIALIALAVACWPDRNLSRAFFGMLTYNALATLFLVYAGLIGASGILLWPAVALHAGLSILLVQAWRKERRAPDASL